MNSSFDKENKNAYTSDEPMKEQNAAETAAAETASADKAADAAQAETAQKQETPAEASAAPADGLYHGTPAQNVETPFRPYEPNPQGYAQTQNPYAQNTQGQNGFAQNTQSQGGYGNPYAQGYAQNQNAYAQSQNGFTQNAQTQSGGNTNPYAQNAQGGYNPNRPYFGGYSGVYPSQNSGSGYAQPAQPVQKQKKQRSGKAAIAVLMVCCVLLSGLFGFGGAYLANSIHPAQAVSGEGAKGGQSVVYQAIPSENGTAALQSENAIVSAAGRAQDSVVEITTETVQTSTFYGQYVTEGAGSGVIITADGYIITCAHVVEGASTVTVRLTDGTELTAEVVGEDSQTDIAVLKINAEGLKPAVIGDSDGLMVGETAIAIGNPLGELGGSVSSGIISALNREITIDGENYNLLQTTAAINPGNSGGGLFNIKGELIGIVNAKSAGSSIEGLGFSIPIKNAMSVAEQLMEYGYIKGRVRLGVTVTEINSSTNTYRIYQENPALLKYVTEYGVYFLEYSGSQSGDLQFGDRIVAIDGTTVSTFADIRNLLTGYSVGDEVTITVARLTGTGRTAQSKMVDVSLTLVEAVPEN